MEIVDELMTPGCSNCFVKHMSTALSYVADGTYAAPVAVHDILLARAVVNFTEVTEGYASHFYFAVGLLNRAEQEAVAAGCAQLARELRDIRSDVQGMEPAAGAAAAVGRLSWRIQPGAYATAHVVEAHRELRVTSRIATGMDPDSIMSAIADVRNEYFDIPDVQPEKGGEEDMAKCCGAAKKAACKGGKCAAPAKKGPAKGGKKCK